MARLPFIDAARLEAALESRAAALTDEERRRNAPGQVELLLSRYHPAAATVAAAEADEWVDVVTANQAPPGAAAGTGGATAAAATAAVVGVPQSVGFVHRATVDEAAKSVRAVFSPIAAADASDTSAVYSSRLHPFFRDAPEPLPWPTIQASIPKRRPRLPVYDDGKKGYNTKRIIHNWNKWILINDTTQHPQNKTDRQTDRQTEINGRLKSRFPNEFIHVPTHFYYPRCMRSIVNL